MNDMDRTNTEPMVVHNGDVDTSSDKHSTLRLTKRAHIARLTAVILLLAASIGIAADALRMGLWGGGIPGPGLWPFTVAILLFAASIVSIVHERRLTPEAMTDTSQWREFVAFVSLAIYLLAFAILGMVVSTFLFLVLWLKYLAGEPWRLTLVLSVLGVGALYLLFEILLGVPFPRGALI